MPARIGPNGPPLVPLRPRFVPLPVANSSLVAGFVYLFLIVVGANVGAAAWAALWAGACVDGGGAAGGWTRPAPGPPLPRGAGRPAAPRPQPAIGRAPEVHLHLHGVSAEDVAVILVRRDE